VIEIEPFGAVDEQGLREVEQALGAPLPPAYREFLARTGGGWAAKPNYLVGPTFEVDVFLGVTGDPGYKLVSSQRVGFAELLPPEVIVVAYADAGEVCLQLSGGHAGRLLWLSHDVWDDVPEGETSWAALQPLADDFQTFLDQVLLPGEPPEEA